MRREVRDRTEEAVGTQNSYLIPRIFEFLGGGEEVDTACLTHALGQRSRMRLEERARRQCGVENGSVGAVRARTNGT